MKIQKRPAFFILLLLASVILLVKPLRFFQKPPDSLPTTSQDSVEAVIGLYDRQHQLGKLSVNSIEHRYVTLSKSGHNLPKEFSSSGNPQLITLFLPGSQSGNSLEDLLAEAYDPALQSLCAAISHIEQPVYLRWCPEMEVPVHIHPWQYQSPVLYNKAFQHFARLVKSFAPSAKILWGPAGYPGTEEYWPGEKAVDLITVTLDAKSELLTTAYPRTSDPAEAIRRKLHRVRFMNKPVLLLGAPSLTGAALSAGQLNRAIAALDREEATIYRTIGQINPEFRPITARIQKPIIGVYDPKNILLSSQSVQAEHLFIDLENVQTGLFLKELKQVFSRKHDAIITVEPWRSKKAGNDSMALLNTINGVYDDEFRAIYQAISNAPQTVYLRFAHEMEIPIHRYAWQSQDPVLYIKAFRYFMNFPSSKAPYIKRVWGPAGDRGSMEWWPGADVVDYISIAIYGLPDKNITDPAKQESFQTIYDRKAYRMRFSGKPLFITEFGVKGSEEFQKNWLTKAADVINTHPEIAGICYFNLADNPAAWGNIPAPDWSISTDTFNDFVHRLADNSKSSSIAKY